MKRFFSFFLVLASFANLRAQEITHIEPSFSDFIPILNRIPHYYVIGVYVKRQ